MTALRAIREIHVRHTSEGAEKVKREIDGQTAANERLEKSSEGVARATETAAKRQVSAQGAYDRLRANVDRTFRAQQDFERGVRTLDRAMSQGVIKSSAEYDRVLGQLRTRTLEMATANENMSRSARLAESAMGAVRNAAAGMAAAFGVSALAGMAEQYTTLTNVLRVVAGEQGNVNAIVDQLNGIATRTRTPLEAIASLYQRTSVAAGELGVSQKDVLRFTESVGMALAQQGGSASQASGALLQLAQALGGGTIQAEEFNSIMDGAFPIALAAAKGIDAAGGSVGRLRKLVLDGKVTSDAFFKAILSQSADLEKAFGSTTPTLSQAFTVLTDNLSVAIGRFNETSGITAGLSALMLGLANNLGNVTKVALSLGVGLTAAFSSAALAAVRTMTAAIGTHLVGAVNALSTAIKLNPLGALAVAATTAVTALYLFSDQIKISQDGVVTLEDYGVAAFNAIGSAASNSAPAIRDYFASLGPAAESAFDAAVSAATGYVDNWITRAADGANRMIGIFKSLTDSVAIIVKAGFESGFTIAMQVAYNAVVEWLARMVLASVDAAQEVVVRFSGVIEKAGNLLGTELPNPFATIDLTTARDRSAEFVRSWKTQVEGPLADSSANIKDAWDRNMSRNYVGEIGEAWTGAARGIAEGRVAAANLAAGLNDVAGASNGAAAAVDKAAEKAKKSFADQVRGLDETVAAIQRQIDTFDASEGATARLEFTTRELAKAWDIAREAGLSAIPAETLRAIEAAAGQIETLTDKLQAMRTVRSAVDEFFPFEKAAREAADLQAVLDNTSLSLTETERTAVQLKIDKGFTDAAKAADDLRGKGTKAAEDIGASFISNVGDVFSDIFGQATRDGQSFFDSVLQGLAGLGSQLAAAGAKNLFGKLFGLPQDAKTQSAAGIGGLIAQAGGYTAANQNTATGSRYGAISSAPLSALNDNLAKTSRSAMDVAKQFAGLNERADTKVLDGFLRASGQWKGLSASDTAWCAAFANAAIAQTGGQGTGSNLASSFMNWGMGTSAPKAGDIVVLKPQARGASGHVGFVAGFGDGTVQVFGGNQSGGANTKSFSLDQVRSYRTANGNASAAVQPASASAAYAPLSRRDLSAGVTDGLKTYQDRYAPSYGDYTARGVDPWQGANGQSLRGVSFGQTALGALGAGAGIFSQGYASGNPLMGGLSGAMGGFQAGSALFPALGMAGPIGAGIGALVGIAGGIFGKRAERKKAHQEAAAKWEQMRPQYEAFDQSLSGDTKGGLRTWVTDQWNQLSGFMSVGGAAWKNGTGNSTAQFRSTGTKLFERFHEMIREFQDGYVSMIHDMESGEGLQGAFAKGRNATKDLKAQIQATRDDIDIAFGNVADIGFLNTPDAVAQAKASEEARSIAIERYNKAAGEYALSLMYTSVQVSDVRKTIDGFRGTAAGLHDVFADLGWSADEATAAIEGRLNQAIANVAKGLNEGIRDRIEELAGVGYFSSVRTFLAEFDTLKADVAAAGADPSQLNDLYGRELQAIVDGAELSGDAFKTLIDTFPQLSGVVREFTAAASEAKRTAEQLADVIASYGDRVFAATNTDQLAAFDRAAQKEREAELKAGGAAMADLERALGAERLAIVRQIADQMAEAVARYDDRTFDATNTDPVAASDRELAKERLVAAKLGGEALVAFERMAAAERAQIVKASADEARQALMTLASNRYTAAVNARAEAEGALRAEYERTVDYVASLRDFVSDMRLDDNLSTLSGREQFDEAQRIFRETLFKANGGDRDAQGKLLDVTRDYQDEAKSYYATSAKYGEVYAEIEAALKATATRAETELDVAKRQAGSLLDIAENTKGLSALLAEFVSAQKAADKAFAGLDANREWGAMAAQNQAIVRALAGQGVQYAGNFGGGQFLNWVSQQSMAQQAIIQPIIDRIAAQFAPKAAMQGGGIVGNGIWNQDSVLARYAGGGNIALAGGEGIITAPAMAAPGMAAFVEAANRGYGPTRMPQSTPVTGGNDNAALEARIDTLIGLARQQIATTGSELNRNTEAVLEGNRSLKQRELAERRSMSNRQVA